MNPKAAMVITAMKIIVEEKIWNTEAADTVIDLHATQAVVAEDLLGRIDESALPVITEETITTAAVAEEVSVVIAEEDVRAEVPPLFDVRKWMSSH